MEREKEIEAEIEKNILECPYNKSRKDKNHGCSDCDSENDILRAELKGRKDKEKALMDYYFKGVEFPVIISKKEFDKMKHKNGKKEIKKHSGNICCEGCYKIGYDDAKKEFESDLLSKSNHILGCMLEGFENVLRYRNLNKEADMLMEAASRIK